MIKTRRPRVYIINDSGHNFNKAKKYGDLVFLTKGRVASYKVTQHFRVFAEQMYDACEDDYILVTSLGSMNAIAGWLMGTLGFPLNLLLHIQKGDKYMIRRLQNNLLKED